jgi:hypothetical protein
MIHYDFKNHRNERALIHNSYIFVLSSCFEVFHIYRFDIFIFQKNIIKTTYLAIKIDR